MSAPRNNTLAIVSLVTGILGLIGVLPLIGSVIAIITGNMARKEIAANPTMYMGDGMAKGGQILGWVGIGVFVVGCCLFLFAFGGLAMLGISADQYSRALTALLSL